MKKILLTGAGILGLLALAVAAGLIYLINWFDNRLLPSEQDADRPVASYAGDEQPQQAIPVSGTTDLSVEAVLHGLDSARPRTRWWWPGSDVDIEVIRDELDAIAAAGFGGVEIQHFTIGMDGLVDEETLAKVKRIDSPEFDAVLRQTMREADRRGLTVDLSNWSGFPAGGPHVQRAESPKNIAYAELEVSGKRTVATPLPLPGKSLSNYAGVLIEAFMGGDHASFRAADARILKVLAYRKTGGERSRNPLNLKDTVELDPGSFIDVTARVSDGVLRWDVPDGDWHIVTLYIIPSGEGPHLIAMPRNGYTVDHMDRDVARGHYNYVFGGERGFLDYAGKGFNGFFNDSLEFKAGRMVTPDILDTFLSRRGYDLTPLLPAVPEEGRDNLLVHSLVPHPEPEFRLTDYDDRLRYDYQLTLSDLFIERFVEESADWAEQRGLVSRGQSYGLDLDVIRALGANHIPEVEQLYASGSHFHLKLAGAAAALYDRNIASAESFVFFNRDFAVTPRRIKAGADKLFLAGVNLAIYHGTTYPWGGDSFGGNGWYPWSSPSTPVSVGTDMSPGTVFWPDMESVNGYLTRVQGALRSGRAGYDVLIYYPFLGFPNGYGRSRSVVPEPLLRGVLPDTDADTGGFDFPLDWLFSGHKPDKKIVWLEQLAPLAHRMDRNGVTWSWTNGHALHTGGVGENGMTARGGTYGVILLPYVTRMPLQDIRALTRLQQAGRQVMVLGDPPREHSGFDQARDKDEAVKKAVQALRSAGAVFISGQDVALRLLTGFAELPFVGETGVQQFHARYPSGGGVRLFANQGHDAARVIVELPPDAGPYWWSDPLSGHWSAAITGENRTLVAELAGYESRLLWYDIPAPDLPSSPLALPSRRVLSQVNGPWTLTGAGVERNTARLFDWRDDKVLKYAEEPVTYMTTFQSSAAGSPVELSLGLVQGAARVILNGRDYGRVAVPPFRVDVTDGLVQGANRLEVVIYPPARNGYIRRALDGDSRYSQFDDRTEDLASAGLIGPVELLTPGVAR